VRGVDLAIYADALAGEVASLAARAERARSRLDALGVFGAVDESATRAELRELEAALDAVEELQSWLERELASAA
jgi:hypothetical protein